MEKAERKVQAIGDSETRLWLLGKSRSLPKSPVLKRSVVDLEAQSGGMTWSCIARRESLNRSAVQCNTRLFLVGLASRTPIGLSRPESECSQVSTNSRMMVDMWAAEKVVQVRLIDSYKGNS